MDLMTIQLRQLCALLQWRHPPPLVATPLPTPNPSLSIITKTHWRGWQIVVLNQIMQSTCCSINTSLSLGFQCTMLKWVLQFTDGCHQLAMAPVLARGPQLWFVLHHCAVLVLLLLIDANLPAALPQWKAQHM
jgi:hypothetical protein